MTTTNDLFLITGATGKTGAHTVRLLREHGRSVRALAHTLDDRAERLAEQGAEVVQGDLLDFPSVSAAMAGVTAVVNMSQISARREAKSNAARQHWIAERLLDRTALVTTHLRPTFFMEWLNAFWVRDGDEGLYRLPLADVRHAPIAAADQAKVIAAILQNPDPHDRQIYPLFGADELDWHSIAAKIGDVLGISVRYQPIEIPTFAAGLTAAGGAPHIVQHLSNVTQDYRDGVFSGMNNLVEVIGGSKPMTVEEHVAATRATFDTDGPYGITDARLSAA